MGSLHGVIVHEGVVTAIRGREVEVRIMRASACSDCAAVSLCCAADAREAVVCAICERAFSPVVGERVVVEGAVRQGLRAALLAYVMPLVLMVGVLAVSVSLLHSEAWSALLAVLSVIIYFAVLHFAVGKTGPSLSFVVKSMDKDK